MLKLREYQEAALKSIKENLDQGINQQVIVLATGTGKTVIFSHVISTEVTAKKKALVIAHREELLIQAKDKINKVAPELIVSVEMADQHANLHECDVVVASVATLGRVNSKRLAKFDPKDFSVVIIDEAHHASADSYKIILRHFGILKSEPEHNWNKDCLLLGVTATPNRTDNKGINEIFEKVTFNYDIEKGVKESHLSRIRAFRVTTATSLNEVHTLAGDFNLGELADAVNNDDRNGLIVAAYKRIVPNKQALCFAVNVEHTVELAKRFVKEGVKADYVLGSTPKEERRAKLEAFSKHELQVVVNAMVLTEGYDEASIDAVLMARPTQSGILYQQMVGRGTRIFPGKEHLTVIDFVDNSMRHRLKSVSTLLDLSGNPDFKGKDIFDAKEKIDELLELAPNMDLDKVDLDKIKYILEEVDIMSGLEVPNEIAVFSKYDWQRYAEDVYRLYLANNHHFTVRKDITDKYSVSVESYDQLTKRNNTIAQTTGVADLQTAIALADKYVKIKWPDQVTIANANSRWRKQPPSEAQLNYLATGFRVNQTVLSQLDKGQASRLISKLKSQKQRGLI